MEDALVGLEANFRRRRWLGRTNRYREHLVDRLKRDTEPGGTLRGADLAQYIAASTALHCADGWAYLGRAVDALAHGDSATTRHLAYYAELRGAMSLLATEGIGVFDRKHFVVESKGGCSLLPQPLGTHQIAWLALEHWASLRRSSALLAEIVRPGGIELSDWLDAFGVGSSLHPLGSRWLKSWGLDLRDLSDDREARNEASYRPTQLCSSAALSAVASAAAVRQVWEMCEPSTSRFEALDRYLLRRSLDELFYALTGEAASDRPLQFGKRVAVMLRRLEVTDSFRRQWWFFLTRRVDPDDPRLVIDAAKTSSVGAPRHHVEVMARATLLLRVATGASARLLAGAGIGADDLAFWWEPLGWERGLWEPAAPPEQLSDLWADARAALEDMGDWEANTSSDTSHAMWRQSQADAIAVLSECERIAFWGLGL
jgi:hypothetical protein